MPFRFPQSLFLGALTLLGSSLLAQPAASPSPAPKSSPAPATPTPTPEPTAAPVAGLPEDPGRELPVIRIPNLGTGAEFYFSPDSKRLIGNAKRDGDENHQVYTLNLDGTDIVRVNNVGKDACSFYFPDGKRIVWTSTRDHLDLPPGDWSKAWDYPQGAELYISEPDGGNIFRLTNNKQYEAEVTVRGDGQYLVFGRQTDGKMDLWRIKPDGTGETRVTNLDGWEPGGSQYIPGSHKLLFRAWKTEDQVKKSKEPQSRRPTPMQLFTVNDDGTDLRQLTHDAGSNWAPFPAPDGKHYVYNRYLDGRNWEVFLGNYENDRRIRLTYNDAFDGMASVSPDGKWLHFSSSRDSKPGERFITLYLIDISSLGIGPPKAAAY